MIIKLILLSVFFPGVYFFLIMPRIKNRPDYSPLLGHYYAHRGLFDNGSDAPENSMKAFQKAVDAGYGIELDVQLTRDGVPVIFHDETLQRACGIKGKLRDYTYEELQQFSLFQSDQHIPRLEDFLNMVDGKVPLIIELKIYESADLVCSATDALIHKYQGTYCVESFHPSAVRWYKKHRPEVIRGQLSGNFNKPGKKEKPEEALVHYLLVNFMGRPDFIAYDHRYKNNISRLLCNYLYKALGVAWTVKSQEQLDACKKDFSIFIFEGFVPKG